MKPVEGGSRDRRFGMSIGSPEVDWRIPKPSAERGGGMAPVKWKGRRIKNTKSGRHRARIREGEEELGVSPTTG